MKLSHRPAITANQVVAYNLAKLRRERGWTHDEAAERLIEYFGVRWSRQTFSSAERSIDGVRPKVFSANEILSFSLVFDVPVARFFEPPAHQPTIYASAQSTVEYHWGGTCLSDLSDMGRGIPAEEAFAAVSTSMDGEGLSRDLPRLLHRLAEILEHQHRGGTSDDDQA